MGSDSLGGDRRGGTTLERLVVWLVVLGLVGGVAYGLGFADGVASGLGLV